MDATPTKTEPSTEPQSRVSRIAFQAGVAIVVVAVALGVSTYLVLTGQTSVEPTAEIVYALLAANALLVVAMIAMIAWQLVLIWRGRQRGRAGARLHVRLVTMFALVAVLPAVLVAVFASVTLDRGLDAWFSERTRAIIDNAQTVAEAYLLEHGQVIRGDAAAMRNDINRAHEVFIEDIDRFGRIVSSQSAIRALSASFVVRRDGTVILSAVGRRDLKFAPPPPEAFEQATGDAVVVFRSGDENMVSALTQLPAFEDAYLYLFRAVDPRVVEHLRKTQAERAEYNQLESSRFDVQVTFALMYVGMSLIFLLAAIWCAIWVANRLVAPIRRLIDAARLVSEGDLDASVAIARREGDLASLGQTFNDMTRDLRSQRAELVEANAQLDHRRRFTEAVLAGVSAGVIGLNRHGRVELVNKPALSLLQCSEDALVGSDLAAAVPEFAEFLAEAIERPARGLVQGQVNLMRDSQERHLQVRVTTERGDRDSQGFVVTFDDVTDLVSAQRSFAWADIARRIAHEIKNPLTPIQLSAERLKRKYGKHIKVDREVFEQCTDTIIRQVGDIGRMVDEFSSFARMPKASIEPNDLHEVVREAVVLQRVAYPELDFVVDVPRRALIAMIDRRLISQAVTNLIKNASEAIEAVARAGDRVRGRIEVTVRAGSGEATIEVIDNGRGLPKEGRHRLIEPYMTTREKGTGLGLAIVRKIMDEHDGTLTLDDAPEVASGGRGAVVRLRLPLRGPGGEGAEAEAGAHAGQELEGAGDGV
jgi:two-component system nitrogen regulation sensor histidine kinase NtrY